ncbi:hypothetical protein DMENIID0001_096380 [Sergentomyia squamirostris]
MRFLFVFLLLGLVIVSTYGLDIEVPLFMKQAFSGFAKAKEYGSSAMEKAQGFTSMVNYINQPIMSGLKTLGNLLSGNKNQEPVACNPDQEDCNVPEGEL